MSLSLEGEKGSTEVPAYDPKDPLPKLAILDCTPSTSNAYSKEDVDRISAEVKKHLADFGVEADVGAHFLFDRVEAIHVRGSRLMSPPQRRVSLCGRPRWSRTRPITVSSSSPR